MTKRPKRKQQPQTPPQQTSLGQAEEYIRNKVKPLAPLRWPIDTEPLILLEDKKAPDVGGEVSPPDPPQEEYIANEGEQGPPKQKFSNRGRPKKEIERDEKGRPKIRRRRNNFRTASGERAEELTKFLLDIKETGLLKSKTKISKYRVLPVWKRPSSLKTRVG